MPKTRPITVDLAVYSLDSIKRAAYRFTNRFALDLRVEGNSALCTLVFDAEIPEARMDQTVSDFRKELLDQDLRVSVREETRDIRNLILAHAFSRTGLIGDVSLPES